MLYNLLREVYVVSFNDFTKIEAYMLDGLMIRHPEENESQPLFLCLLLSKSLQVSMFRFPHLQLDALNVPFQSNVLQCYEHRFKIK